MSMPFSMVVYWHRRLHLAIKKFPQRFFGGGLI